MGVDAHLEHVRFAPASACSTCRTRAIRASTWPATRQDVVRTPPTSSSVRTGTPPSLARARMSAACSRRSSASRSTTCSATTSTEAPPGCCSTSSTCSARSGATRRSRSATSARAATSSSACSIATTCLPGPGNVQDKRPYPEFTRVQTIGNVAEARYNSLTAKLTRRLNNGFSALIGYTLSKSRDNGSGIRTLAAISCSRRTATARRMKSKSGCEWGISIFDTRHRVVSSILYELPFGRGRKWAQGGVGNAILGGWQVTNIMSLSSGFARNPNVRRSREPGPRRSEADTSSARIRTTDRRRFRSGSPNQHLCCSRQPHTATPNGTASPDRGFSTSTCRSCGTSRSAAARAFSSGWRRSTRSTSPSGTIRTRTVTSAQYGNITSTRKPMRELQLGVKFGF